MRNIQTLLAAQVEQEQDYIREFEEVRAMLLPLEGKEINGRTFNKKRLGAFRFEDRYGMFHIEGKYRHLIGYASRPFVSVSDFDTFDKCHGQAARDRIEQCKTVDADRLQEIQSTMQEAFETIKAQFRALESENLGSYHNPIYYDMIRAIHDESEKRGPCKLALHDFYYIRNEERA